MRLPRPAWLFVLGVSFLRLIAASRFPLTGDEAYYWAWSRHLAYGYIDHPPMVAWLIALSAPFGRAPGFVRLPFVICEAVAALALGGAALRLARDPRAGAVAAVAFTLLPQTKLALGEALPDGPFLMCWALALYLLARGGNAPSRRLLVALGCALGGVLLSRAFGWALVCGVFMYALAPQRRPLLAKLWIAFAIAAALYAPFIYWNAVHGWANLAFTVHDRQPFETFAFERVAVLSSLRLLVVALLIWSVALFVALRPALPLITWTALPLPTLLVALAFFYKVESYWVLGPAASLCVGLGVRYRAWTLGVRRALEWAAGGSFGYVTLGALFVALPEPSQARLLHATNGSLRGPFYSGAFAYAPLSVEVGALADSRSGIVITDRNEIAAELTYDGITALMIGDSPQSRQWEEWRNGPPTFEHALFVSYAPLQLGTERWRTVSAAFASIAPGPTLRPRFAGIVADTFYTEWCTGPQHSAFATLLGARP